MDVVGRDDLSKVPDPILDTFRFDGPCITSEPLPGGHIHQSFLVTCTGARYVLQRLNDRVFPDPEAMTANVERIVRHLGGQGCAELVTTQSGNFSYRAADGSWWRSFRYLEGTVARASPAGPEDAFEAARAFAHFVRAMASLPGPPLLETIEAFHGLQPRRAALDAAEVLDSVGRRTGVLRDLDRVRRLGQQVEEALSPWSGTLPIRTVHNDAKLSNIRFDMKTGRATFVVDLDTTMSGYAQYDVGELVRTVTTRCPEDADEDAVVDFDLELLAALSDGYSVNWPELEPQEVEAMALAGPQMATENATRFLTDHLVGDLYFSIDRPGQNLDRCRTQLRLAESMLDSHAEIASCFARSRRRSQIEIKSTASPDHV
jgi:Ser/Thr protein kinase RdoA (MazF antagonist)